MLPGSVGPGEPTGLLLVAVDKSDEVLVELRALLPVGQALPASRDRVGARLVASRSEAFSRIAASDADEPKVSSTGR